MCGSFLEISKSIWVLTMYSGNDTKLVMNKTKIPYKQSRFTGFFYKLLIIYIFIMITFATALGLYQVSYIDDPTF